MEKYYQFIQFAFTAIGTWISAKFGILFPVLKVLLVLMIIDYITGMLASKSEAIEHPHDNRYGWNSKKGAKGIMKKVGYLCVIGVAVVLDYMIVKVSGELHIEMQTAYLGVLVSIWYVLNEALSIVENAGRMGVAVPDWLKKYIAVLQDKMKEDY